MKSFSNGDGLCYLDERGKLCGFRVNRVDGNKLYPQEMPRVKPKTRLYRNFDQEFERVMQKKSAERKIAVTLRLEENNFGFTLSVADEDDNRISLAMPREKELARTPQLENLKNQLVSWEIHRSRRKVWKSFYRTTGLFLHPNCQTYADAQ